MNCFCIGLFSSLMRDQANMPGDAPKWIILDGDIDPMWIESLNTLMDDNKVCEPPFDSILPEPKYTCKCFWYVSMN